MIASSIAFFRTPMVFDGGRFPAAYDKIIRRLRQSGHGQEACPKVVGLVANIDKEVGGCRERMAKVPFI